MGESMRLITRLQCFAETCDEWDVFFTLFVSFVYVSAMVFAYFATHPGTCMVPKPQVMRFL